jgi:dolichol kinase
VEPYARKLFHAAGVVIVALYWWAPLERAPLAAGLAGIALSLGVFDLIRARLPAVQERFLALFSRIVAEKDKRGWNGSTLYFTGCAATVALFDEPSACAGILSLALGDSLAAVVGMSVRSPRWGRVSLAGSATCFLASSAACSLFFPWPIAIAGGAAATALEAFSGSKLDNLLIPIGTAATLLVLGT